MARWIAWESADAAYFDTALHVFRYHALRRSVVMTKRFRKADSSSLSWG
jgi:hypothetical protein